MLKGKVQDCELEGSILEAAEYSRRGLKRTKGIARPNGYLEGKLWIVAHKKRELQLEERARRRRKEQWEREIRQKLLK